MVSPTTRIPFSLAAFAPCFSRVPRVPYRLLSPRPELTVAILPNAGAVLVGLTKFGAGTMSLSVASTYTGTATICEGTLRVALSRALTGAAGPIAISGGKLDSSVASATLGGSINLSTGTLAPNGTSAGSFTLASTKTFSMFGGTFEINLGSTFDQISAHGGETFSITGGNYALTLGSGFAYTNTYNVLAGFTGANTVSGLTFTGYDSGNYTLP